MSLIKTVVLALFGLLFVSACCDQTEFIEIPQGYVGKVVIKHDRGCETSTAASGGTTIRVNNSGLGCAPFKPASGTLCVHYYYTDVHGVRVRELKSTGWGKGGEIWSEASTTSGDEYEFFVGTEEAFNRHSSSQP